MEVVILYEPLVDLHLLADSIQAKKKEVGGYLLGQKLVKTYLVQKIMVVPEEQLFSPATFILTEAQSKLEILGIFSFGRETGIKKKMKQPLFCEKIALFIRKEKKAGFKISSSLLRFDRRFYFARPDRLLLEVEGGNA
ncbi:MAG TPA: hypothetical protein PLL62_00495 [Candidatus Saccharicenans sp.]|nr:hypothetical protein [Candidatus Saccharicenans sp.]HQM73701.1 hypothetical protein [Candidatus Saccharicenans sp.]